MHKERPRTSRTGPRYDPKELRSVTAEHFAGSSPSALFPVAATPSEPQLRTRQTAMSILLLAAVAVLPYLATLRNGFVYDDFDQVLANPYIRNFHHLREIFTTSVWSFMGDFRGSSNYYRPVMSLGYLLCYQLFGPHALGFHLANLLANLGVVFLVFLVTLGMFRSAGGGAGRGVYLCASPHPQRSGGLDCRGHRTGVGALLPSDLLVFLVSARARQARPRLRFRSPWRGALCSPCFPRSRRSRFPCSPRSTSTSSAKIARKPPSAQKIRRYGALWLLAAVYLVLRARYLGGFAPSLDRPGIWDEDVGDCRPGSVWPVLLETCCGRPYSAPITSFPPTSAALIPWAVGGVVALGFARCLWSVCWKSNRQAAFGVVWLLATLAPVLNVRWMTSNPFAERYLYLASVGFCWIVGWAGVRGWNLLASAWQSVARRAARWRPSASPRFGWFASSLEIATGGITSPFTPRPSRFHRTPTTSTIIWEPYTGSTGTIPAAENEWRTALRLAPESEYALHNLGLVANEEKHYRQAELLFLHALAIRPNYRTPIWIWGKLTKPRAGLQEAEAQMRTAESPFTPQRAGAQHPE